MPCHDPGGNWGPSYSDIQRAEEKADQANRLASELLKKMNQSAPDKDYLKSRLDEVTAHLCYTLRAIRKFAPDVEKEVLDMNPLLKKWWVEHQQWDEEREKNK
jgi:hypothetical protein